MKVSRKLIVGLVCLLLLFAAAASACRTGSPAAAEGLDVIRALGDARAIRAATRMAEGGLERIYYVAAEGDRDVFCVLARSRGGKWAREAEAFEALPGAWPKRPASRLKTTGASTSPIIRMML